MNIQPAKPEISVEQISIVLVGDFNPKIFHPMWFLHEELIRESEAEEADIDISHQDVSSFRLDWLTVQVLRHRFTATIKADVYKKHLGDLILNVFSKLSHTPIRQFGMNTSFRIRFKSSKDWHAFGHFLVPKSPWAKVLNQPGMLNCNVQGVRVDDNRPGHVHILVAPDIPQSEVIIEVNDHFDAPSLSGRTQNSLFNAKWAIEIMLKDYESSIGRAAEYTNNLIDNFCSITSVDNGGK